MKIYILYFCIGVIIGMLMSFLYTKKFKKNIKNISGVIRVDTSDPVDEPYLFLELNPGCNPSSFKDGKIISFLISTKNYLSQD